MFDLRHPKEIEAIRAVCEMENIDPTEWLADPRVDLLEAGKRLAMIRAVRAARQVRIESTVSQW